MKVIEYDKNVDICGTSLQGTINTTYDKLVSVLGKPSYTDADPYEKVACSWDLQVKYYDTGDSGDDWSYEKVSIYCWKEGKIPTKLIPWHVGGNSWIAEDLANQIIFEEIEPSFEY